MYYTIVKEKQTIAYFLCMFVDIFVNCESFYLFFLVQKLFTIPQLILGLVNMNKMLKYQNIFFQKKRYVCITYNLIIYYSIFDVPIKCALNFMVRFVYF